MGVLSCSIVTGHRPEPLTGERHHVVPRSWQKPWAPAVPPFPGQDPDGPGMLWDSRTVAVCPTHHRNVHVLIVALMHQAALLNADKVPSTPLPGLPGKVLRAHEHELEIARLGLQRVLDAGGSLLTLTAAGEWGQA